MNRFIIFSFFAGLIFSVPAFAQEAMKAPDVKATEAAPANAVEIGNKICPVSGEKVKEGEAYKIKLDGKIYNLCCQMCEKDFKKDPEKYIKKIEEEMQVK